jgi:hypothetical protein
MNPAVPADNSPIRHLVVVRPEPPCQYTAQAVGLPEVRATAASREEAIKQVRDLLNGWLASGQLEAVEVSGENPLLKWFGHTREDPDFDVYLEEIRRFREEMDEQHRRELEARECSNSSSTPTT